MLTQSADPKDLDSALQLRVHWEIRKCYRESFAS